MAHSLGKAGPLLSQLALSLKLPQTSSLMHIRRFQKQPQLLLPYHPLKACHHLKMQNLLRVPPPPSLVLVSLQAISSPDCTAPEPRRMIVMSLLPAARRPLIALSKAVKSKLKKIIHQLSIFVPELQIQLWLS